MLKNLRVNIVRQLVETAEGLFFNPKLLRQYRHLFGDRLKVAIDVGVNCGQTIDLLLKVNPDCRIYGFEPNPKLFQALQAKYAGQQNISLFQVGVSAENGEKTFHENVLHSTSSLEELDYSSAYLKKKSKVLGVKPEGIIADSYTIQVVSLSSFIATHLGNEKIDLLKIDTEGHEYYCLEGLFNGAQHKLPAYIQLESHNDDMYKGKRSFAEIEGLLHTNRYRIKEKIRHAFGDFDELFYERLEH